MNKITSADIVAAVEFLEPLGIQFKSINEETLSIIKHLTDDMYIQNRYKENNIKTSDNLNIEYPWNDRYGCKLYLENSLGVQPEEKNNIFALQCNGYCKNENIICPFYDIDYQVEKDNLNISSYNYYGFEPCKMSFPSLINVKSYFEQFKSSLEILVEAKKDENNAEKS